MSCARCAADLASAATLLSNRAGRHVAPAESSPQVDWTEQPPRVCSRLGTCGLGRILTPGMNVNASTLMNKENLQTVGLWEPCPPF